MSYFTTCPDCRQGFRTGHPHVCPVGQYAPVIKTGNAAYAPVRSTFVEVHIRGLCLTFTRSDAISLATQLAEQGVRA